MVQVVLVHPEIPPNAGNVIRLCANTGARLHLVEPLGFSLEDRQLRRAGLDYHEFATLDVHRDWAACRERLGRTRLVAFSAGGEAPFAGFAFRPDDALVFGPESTGLPPEILADFDPARRLRLPMRPGNRSLNLSNAVAVAVFEAWRQAGYAGGS